MTERKTSSTKMSSKQLIAIAIVIVLATIGYWQIRSERQHQENVNADVNGRLTQANSATDANAQTLETVNEALGQLCKETTKKEQMEQGVRYTCQLQEKGETNPVDPELEPIDIDDTDTDTDNGQDVSPEQVYTLEQLRSIAASEVAKAIRSNMPDEGPPGKDGKDGDKGDKGDTGDPGGEGGQGTPGLTAYELAVMNGFEGSREEWLDSLEGVMGLQGAKGDTGDKGETGNTGATGASAYEIAQSQGFIGTRAEWLSSLQGKDGQPGAAGASAYEIAQQNGFAGTRSEWLQSLQGKNGTDGKDGQDGEDAELPPKLIIDMQCSSNDQIIVSYYGGTFRYITISDPLTGTRLDCTSTAIM